jgi:hypothetical protein
MSIHDANGHSTTFSYLDPQNTYAHVTSWTNALNQTETWSYDNTGTGHPLSKVDVNGMETTYAYNEPLDRLTQIALAVGRPEETHTNFVYFSPTEVDVYKIKSRRTTET